MNDGDTRELTPSEVKALNLIIGLEKVIDNRRITVQIHANAIAYDAAKKINNCPILKATPDPKLPGNYFLTYLVNDYARYVHYVLSQIGMKLNIDGSVTTYDNRIIDNSFLNRGMI